QEGGQDARTDKRSSQHAKSFRKSVGAFARRGSIGVQSSGEPERFCNCSSLLASRFKGSRTYSLRRWGGPTYWNSRRISMGVATGISLLWLAAGAILTCAVTATTSGIDLDAVGVILMVVGIIGLLFSLLFL